MYFIDVQPFDRRYSQSQAARRRSGGDNEQQQISQRQREILVSTWNLLREQQQRAAVAYRVLAPVCAAVARALHDNATLLATLQNKLAAQAQSLPDARRHGS